MNVRNEAKKWYLQQQKLTTQAAIQRQNFLKIRVENTQVLNLAPDPETALLVLAMKLNP
ncbi:hypothetical protein HUO09_17860 [Vibrio sp. Y2-5]|uniref:hypothetical protein n=1 Tax=Vibrio sp. Y2-5 TaxID=2743977 RepID=UPI00166075FF|nr:hypothetical protein [Vibrio sp. Y2-5]MBD0788225.1 hypothetical protein [Vibrio sp. Y2-5]